MTINQLLKAFKQKTTGNIKQTLPLDISQGLKNHTYLQNSHYECYPYWLEEMKKNQTSLDIEEPFILNNTKYKNWSTLSFPKTPYSLYVDPKGLLNCDLNSFSIDVWIDFENTLFLASQHKTSSQQLHYNQPKIQTHFQLEDKQINLFAKAYIQQKRPLVELSCNVLKQCKTTLKGCIYFVIRAYNPLGFCNLNHINYLQQGAFMINHQLAVILPQQPSNIICQALSSSDLLSQRNSWRYIFNAQCDYGTLSALAAYPFELNNTQNCEKSILLPLSDNKLKTTKKHKKFLWAPFLKKRIHTLKKTPKTPLILSKQSLNLSCSNTLIQNALNASFFYLKTMPNQSSLNLYINNEHSILYFFLCIASLKSNLNNEAQFYATCLNLKLSSKSPASQLLRFLCVLIIITKSEPTHTVLKQMQNRFQETLNQALKHIELNTILKQINSPSTWNSIETETLESLLYLSFISKEISKHSYLKTYIKPEHKQFLNPIFFNRILKEINREFITILLNQKKHYGIYSHPILFAASMLDLFDDDIKLVIYNHFKSHLLSFKHLFLEAPITGIYPSYTMQWLILNNQLQHKVNTFVFEGLFDLCSDTFAWPTLCNPKTEKGKYGLGHDLGMNALFISLYASFFVKENKDGLRLFNQIDCLIKQKEHYHFQLDQIKTAKGLLSLNLKKKEGLITLCISIQSLNTVPVTCVFPEKINDNDLDKPLKEKLKVGSKTSSISLLISNEAKTFTFTCDEQTHKKYQEVS